MKKRHEPIDHEKLLLSLVLRDHEAMAIVVRGYASEGIPSTDPQPEGFADARHRVLWRCFQDLLARGQIWHGFGARAPILDWLAARDKQGQVSEEYLDQLLEYMESVGQMSTDDVWRWAQRVADNAQKRELVALATSIAERAGSPEESAQALSDELAKRVAAMRKGGLAGFLPVPSFGEVMEQMDAVWVRGERPLCVPTGFQSLDEFIGGGMVPGQLIVLGGRPATGKSMFGWQIARNVAARLIKNGEPGLVAFVSLEMQVEPLLARARCMEARVDMTQANLGRYVHDEHTYHKLEWAKQFLQGLSNLMINVRQGLTSWQIYNLVMGLQAIDTVQLVVIDYAELVADKGDSEIERVGGIFSAAANMAKELNVPVILLSQLNREVERERSKEPEIHHLRWEGERYADKVWMAYWPGKHSQSYADSFPSWVDRMQIEVPVEDEYSGTSGMKKKSVADPSRWYLLIKKDRFGSEGHVKFLVEPQYTLISDLSVRLSKEDF